MTILDTNQWLALALVLGTAIAILLLGIEIGRGLGPRRDDLEDAGEIPHWDRPVPYLITRRGWVDFVPYGPPAGAADPGAFEVPRARRPRPSQPADLMELLDDAFDIAERQMTARQVAAEVRVIEAEVDAHPERWRTR